MANRGLTCPDAHARAFQVVLFDLQDVVLYIWMPLILNHFMFGLSDAVEAYNSEQQHDMDGLH